MFWLFENKPFKISDTLIYKLVIDNVIDNPEVKAFIKQEKNSGTSKVFGKQSNWEAYIQGELRKNAVVKGYLENLERIQIPKRPRILLLNI